MSFIRNFFTKNFEQQRRSFLRTIWPPTQKLMETTSQRWFVLMSILLSVSLGPLGTFGLPTLELDATYSPPATIPSDPADLIYSAPAMDHMLEPVKVLVLDDNNNLITEPVTVVATTVLASGLPGDTYDGVLCTHNKWTHRFGLCRYLDDGCVELSCNSSDPSYPLGKVDVVSENGVATFPRLLHTKPSTNGPRKLQFTAVINGTGISVTSNPFNVDLQAAKLEITSPMLGDPGNVYVNQPMSFTVQTKAEDPSTPGTYIDLTTGRHSILNVDLTIAYDEKRFYIYFPGGNFNLNQIVFSTYNLAGTEVEENGKLDRRVRKQCVNGAATFNDIRITTEAVDVRLNFTQTLSYYPWERWPPIYNGTTILDWTTFTLYALSDGENSPGVALTPPFNVTVPVIDSLVIDPASVSNFATTADANFPLKTPVNIQALDASGNIITDGPDSALAVTLETNPSSACLSVDSSFQLSQGQAVFPGSICEPIGSLELRFSVVSDGGVTRSTAWTPTFTVTGEFRIASIYPIFAEVNTDLFTAAAVDLVNKGVWEPSFSQQGRRMECQYYFVPSSDIQETLAIYDKIHTQNTDPSQTTIRAIIGSVTDEDTIALSRTSRRHGIPIMGYVAESSELSDKSAHPYFSRVSFGEGAKYYAEGAYLASHHWNKVIVIKDSDHPVPAVMYQGFEAHGVQIVLEVTVPALPGEPSDFSALRPLDDLAQQIFAAGTRVIYTFTFAPNDIYLYHEAIRLKFAPVFGYQWMGNVYVLSSFPFTNSRGDCAILDPPCTTAFNSTVDLSPSNNAELEAPYWANYLYDAYTQQDPYKLPSTTVWRWPSVLGALAKGHDAAIALFLGAMKIIGSNETITGLKLAQMSRTVTFEGGSGYISFDENGDRPGFSATIFNWNPVTDTPVDSNEVVWPAGTFTIDPQTLEPREAQSNLRSLAGGVVIPGFVSYAPINYTNTRSIQGYAPGSTVLETLVSQVPAPYWCSEGCGGGLASVTNGTIYYYNYGTCVAQDSCDCKNKPNSDEPGYAGSSCQQILCDPPCRNGECIEPDVCQCEPFWTGPDCATPQCTVSGCNGEHGNCTGPNICTCQAGYWGSDCAQRCTCQNGICNDGQGGTGTCSECNSIDFMGADCNLSISSVVVPVVVGLAIIVTAIIVFVVWYIRRMKFRAALANNDWIVDYNDVIIVADDKGGANSMAFRSMVSLHADSQRQKNVIRNQGKWNGIEVAIKMLNKDSVHLTTQQRLEVKAMRDIRHQNLASFVGGCCDSPNVCILMESAPKGSLDDILSSDAINLDWNFKYALLKDICRGMIYLSNSPIKSHGRLKSSNCVVDNRWTLKITDYGMHLFKSNQHDVPHFNPALGPGQFSAKELEEGIENSVKAALLYAAPEFLRSGVSHPDHVGAGTIQGDMYSLAIIMMEVLTHESPYYEYLDYVEVDEVLDAIAGRKMISAQLPQAWPKTDAATSLHLRPNIPEDADPAFRRLVELMWVENPEGRPTFQQVLKELNSLSPQRGDLMDNLIQMLEKYSTNLEAVVAERTGELAAEKAKTEELICRMLPKSIVDQLKQGKQVSAESFDCVTIYFSDIVGFTKIAGGSTPLQVVDLLNDLYTCFDAIIDHFDVYKVETIGDAYMVVSGLPIRNGDQHAGEIASMSLHLLSAILSFTIRHMPETKLQLRIGIHSGPAVAGVVGLKMPRYCLFGDTVNTASRMESGGLALRIHMSDSTAAILTKLGGYQIVKRGEREVKGKGVMTTYWLKNQDGFSRPLPSEEMAVSESQHEFK